MDMKVTLIRENSVLQKPKHIHIASTHMHFITADQETLANNGASPLLSIPPHSAPPHPSSSPPHPPPPHPLPYSPLPSLSPPPTSDGVVGGCEVGQCVEVPQEDAVLQTTADSHLSLGGVGQSFDVVLVCPQCGRALPRLGVPQLQSGVRGGREDWSHKREMMAQLQSPPLPQHTHSLFLPPWQRTMSLTQSVWCSMARTY